MRAHMISWQTNLLWLFGNQHPQVISKEYFKFSEGQSSANRHIRKQPNSCWAIDSSAQTQHQQTSTLDVRKCNRHCSVSARTRQLKKKKSFFKKPQTSYLPILKASVTKSTPSHAEVLVWLRGSDTGFISSIKGTEFVIKMKDPGSTYLI